MDIIRTYPFHKLIELLAIHLLTLIDIDKSGHSSRNITGREFNVRFADYCTPITHTPAEMKLIMRNKAALDLFCNSVKPDVGDMMVSA